MQKKLLALAIGTVLIVGLSACSGTQKTDDPQKIVSQKCFVCHGDNLKGAVGPNLQHIGSKLSKAQILDILKNGKTGGMPAGVVTGKDAEKVAAWLAAKK